MLHRKPDPHLASMDPDLPMVGRCVACGSVVHCLRADCTLLEEPAFGQVLCAGCPKVVGEDREGRAVTCGRRVRMTPVVNKERS
jgi:hypothetical protein